MVPEEELTPLGRELARWLSGRSFGAVHVARVEPRLIVDVDGYNALDLTVVAEDPESDTWPVDDVVDLHRAVVAETQRLRSGPPMGMDTHVGSPDVPPIYVTLRPVTESPQDEEAAEDLSVSGR